MRMCVHRIILISPWMKYPWESIINDNNNNDTNNNNADDNNMRKPATN